MDNKFNERLKKLRIDNGLTQAQIADALGIKLNTYTHIEKDGKRLSPELLQKLSKIFLVSIDSLMGEEKPKQNVLFPHITPIEPLKLSDHSAIDPLAEPPAMMKDLLYVEQNIILKYRLLSDEDKIKLQKYIDRTYKKNNDSN